VARHGGSVRAECRQCGRVAIFAPGDLAHHWRQKGSDGSWPNFARHLVCRRPDGCGERFPMVSWLVSNPPPPDDPEPPKPRFTRTKSAHWKPHGIDQDAWDACRDDRDRKRLVRSARG
jgi:hypothetical protein